jgi:hypothetical protein
LKRLYEAIENGVVDMADPSLKRSYFRTYRGARPGAGRRGARNFRGGATQARDHVGQFAAVRARGSTQAAERRWNLSAGPFACACTTRRGRRSERDSHPGVENRTTTDTCRRCKRRIGGCWRSQFYTEVAHPFGESSNGNIEANSLFEALEDWNTQLQQHNIQFEEPSP